MFSRHDLVWLSADGWNAAAGQALPADADAIELWRRKDWPAIVRRGDAGAAPDIVSLGIALPPDDAGNKRRVAVRARREHVVRHMPALPLRHAIKAAPAAWRPGLAALSETLPCLRAYGSLALQALTGSRYLTESSDIDLLAFPSNAVELDAAVGFLSAHAAALPLDGEIVFPNGDAVAWKEWRNAASSRARVLVKSIDAVRLADMATLRATLEAA